MSLLNLSSLCAFLLKQNESVLLDLLCARISFPVPVSWVLRLLCPLPAGFLVSVPLDLPGWYSGFPFHPVEAIVAALAVGALQ